MGVMSADWVNYDTHASKFRFKRALSAKQITALSCRGSADAECIYLYHDGCVPTDNDATWETYSARLQRLAAYKIEG